MAAAGVLRCLGNHRRGPNTCVNSKPSLQRGPNKRLCGPNQEKGSRDLATEGVKSSYEAVDEESVSKVFKSIGEPVSRCKKLDKQPFHYF